MIMGTVQELAQNSKKVLIYITNTTSRIKSEIILYPIYFSTVLPLVFILLSLISYTGRFVYAVVSSSLQLSCTNTALLCLAFQPCSKLWKCLIQIRENKIARLCLNKTLISILKHIAGLTSSVKQMGVFPLTSVRTESGPRRGDVLITDKLPPA